MDDKYYKYFLKKTIKNRLKKFTFSKSNHKADIVFLGQKKNNNAFLFKIKIKGIVKSFEISKELLNHKENILASLSIITNYYDPEKLKKNLLDVSKQLFVFSGH